MVKCAIIDLDTAKVINIIDYSSVPTGLPPGFEGNVIALEAPLGAGPGMAYSAGAVVVPPIQELPTSEVGTTPPRLMASALSVSVDGPNFDIPTALGVFNIVGFAYLDVGLYMAFFLNEEPNTDYLPVFNGGAPCMGVVEKGTGYVIIEAKDGVGGNPVDPSTFGLQIYRV